jgi:hypothetical protein
MAALTKLPMVGDNEQQRQTYQVERSLNALEAAALANAVIVGPIAIGTADTRVFHGLNQRPTGYFLVRSPSDVRVFDGATYEAIDPQHFITLRLSTAATVWLCIF